MSSDETLESDIAGRVAASRSHDPGPPCAVAETHRLSVARPRGLPGPTAKFKQIADLLESRIVSGQFAIGDTMPSEAELVELHGVSRYTVRSALDELERLGFIQRRKGTRAIVVARTPNRGFAMHLQSLGDEVQHLPAALFFEHRERRHVTRATARDLGLGQEGTWVFSRGVRRAIGSGAVVSAAVIWIRPEFEPLLASLAPIDTPLHRQLQTVLNVRIERLEISIGAAMTNERERRAFGLDKSAACLRVTRRYLDDARRVALVKCDTYLADRFTYRVAFDRETGIE